MDRSLGAPGAGGSAVADRAAAGALLGPAEVRALRPPRPAADPWRAHGATVEDERLPGGGRARVLTVFLTGAECPYSCVFCDLWRYTTPGPTPAGAIPAQLRSALDRHAAEIAAVTETARHLKLYNASNAFDRRAVPPADDPKILRLAEPFDRLVVECHPRLVGERCREWARARGRGRLEVAMGLETVHPTAQPLNGKGADLDHFARAAERLAAWGAGWRAFVLVGAPDVPPREDATWVERTVRWALEHGAHHVTLIPVRGGNGALEQLAAEGRFTPPTLATFEQAAERCLPLAEVAGKAVIDVDPWDLDSLAGCPSCGPRRRARLELVHRTGAPGPPVVCGACG